MQAQLQLGLLYFAEKESETPPQPNLPLARHSIDMLATLQEKTRGNLTPEEQRLLENSLTELRFRFVQIADERNRQRSGAEAPAGAQTSSGDQPIIVTADGGKGTKTE